MNKELTEDHIKRDICRIGKLVYHKGFVASNDGNISYRLNDQEILITPTGKSKGFIEPEEIVKVSYTGELIEGTLQPSSELKMHLKVYAERPDIHSVVHVHPPYATAHAIAGLSLDQATMPETVVFLGTIPLAEYATPSTDELPNSISSYVHHHRGVLLEHHGALTWGDNLDTAYFIMESLEFCAKINWIARLMNGIRELPQERVAELLKIKKKLGIEGESPQGVSHSNNGNRNNLGQVEENQLNFTEEKLNRLVERVTKSVIQEISNLGGKNK